MKPMSRRQAFDTHLQSSRTSLPLMMMDTSAGPSCAALPRRTTIFMTCSAVLSDDFFAHILSKHVNWCWDTLYCTCFLWSDWICKRWFIRLQRPFNRAEQSIKMLSKLQYCPQQFSNRSRCDICKRKNVCQSSILNVILSCCRDAEHLPGSLWWVPL